jgi:hypothetical protein
MRYDTVPEWRTGIATDFETTVEVTIIITARVMWDAVESREDVREFIKDIVLGFCAKYADMDWRETDLDYEEALDAFTLNHIAANSPGWLHAI